MYIYTLRMKQIPSQFLEEADYDKLVAYKEKMGYTWKDLYLYHIKEVSKHEA